MHSDIRVSALQVVGTVGAGHIGQEYMRRVQKVTHWQMVQACQLPLQSSCCMSSRPLQLWWSTHII